LWRALNIYDDFLDGDGRSENLPTANSYYRRFLEIYYRLNLKSSFYCLFNKIIADLDEANRREVLYNKLKIKNGRIFIPRRLPNFPDLTKLSRKSLALGLNAIALLYISGAGKNSYKIRATLNFFRAALAAKQLADDAQDWLEDLEGGIITSANVLVLRAAKNHGLILNLRKNSKMAYLLFATEASAKLSIELGKLCQRAKSTAEKAGLNTQGPLIKNLINPLESGLREASEFRAQWIAN
jgi:hypothetical protein